MEKVKSAYDRIKWVNGRWYEDGRILPKREIIYFADCKSGEFIMSKRSGHMYKLSVIGRRNQC